MGKVELSILKATLKDSIEIEACAHAMGIKPYTLVSLMWISFQRNEKNEAFMEHLRKKKRLKEKIRLTMSRNRRKI